MGKKFQSVRFFCLNSPTMLWKNSGQGVKACFYNVETTLCFPCRSSLIVNLMKSHRLFMVRLGCTRRGEVAQEAIGTYNCSIVAMQWKYILQSIQWISFGFLWISYQYININVWHVQLQYCCNVAHCSENIFCNSMQWISYQYIIIIQKKKNIKNGCSWGGGSFGLCERYNTCCEKI